MQRLRFHGHSQLEGESGIIFVAALCKLTEHCKFRDVLNDSLRDILVCGLKNGAIQKKLLTISLLTSLTMEMVSKEVQQLHAAGGEHKLGTTSSNAHVLCLRCGKSVHSASPCWCKEMNCQSCGKNGHVGRASRHQGKLLCHHGVRLVKGNPSRLAGDKEAIHIFHTIAIDSVMTWPDCYMSNLIANLCSISSFTSCNEWSY